MLCASQALTQRGSATEAFPGSRHRFLLTDRLTKIYLLFTALLSTGYFNSYGVEIKANMGSDIMNVVKF